MPDTDTPTPTRSESSEARPKGAKGPARSAVVYRHRKRGDWGLATVVWERDGKRGYRFEDGTERAFALEFAAMFEPVDAPGVAASLALGTEIEPTFDDQVALFREGYPGGFEDPAWLANFRGVDAPRRLKRHRDAAIDEANELLGREVFDQHIAARRFADVLAAIARVLGRSDLVTKGQVDAVRGAPPSERLVTAIRDMLHGEEPLGIRFDRYCRELAAAGLPASSWSFVTALPALVDPEQHAAVRPTVFKTQAKCLDLRWRLASSPTPTAYGRWLELANAVRQGLRERNVVPKDFLDVHDFVAITLRPGAQDDLRRHARARTARAAGDASDDAPAAA